MPETIAYKIIIDSDGYGSVYDGADEIKSIVSDCGVKLEDIQCFPGEEDYTYILKPPSDNIYSSLKERIDELKCINEMEADTEIPDEKLERLDDSSP